MRDETWVSSFIDRFLLQHLAYCSLLSVFYILFRHVSSHHRSLCTQTPKKRYNHRLIRHFMNRLSVVCSTHPSEVTFILGSNKVLATTPRPTNIPIAESAVVDVLNQVGRVVMVALVADSKGL